MDDIYIYIYIWMYVCTHCYDACVLAVARMIMMMMLLRCHVIRVYCRASLSLSLSFPGLWAGLCCVPSLSPLPSLFFLSLHGAFSLPSKKRYTHSSVACLFFCVVAAPNIITLLSLCYYDLLHAESKPNKKERILCCPLLKTNITQPLWQLSFAPGYIHTYMCIYMQMVIMAFSGICICVLLWSLL